MASVMCLRSTRSGGGVSGALGVESGLGRRLCVRKVDVDVWCDGAGEGADGISGLTGESGVVICVWAERGESDALEIPNPDEAIE
jgi:hypothetical protein